MPFANVNDTRLYYEDTGPGSTGRTIVFSHGLLWSSEMFAPQVAHLRDRYRCIAYDHRGQGKSADGSGRRVGLEQNYHDAVALVESLGVAPVCFAGLSMGGFVAMRVGARRPDLVSALILMETSADPEPSENVSRYRAMNFVARFIGLRLVTDPVMPIMFAQQTLADPARATERAEWRRRLMNNRRSIYRAVNGVVERESVYPELARIRVPTLVMVGDQDVATVPAKAERIHAAIAGSQIVRIPGAGHTSTLEQPARVNAALDAFLATAFG